MDKDIEKAKELLVSGGYTCVLVKDGSVLTSTLRGVKPLLQFLDGDTATEGYSAADKVVGNGAAFLYVLMKVSSLHAQVISASSVKTLTDNGITVTWDEKVDHIINREGTGFCPIEMSVEGITDPSEALIAVRKRYAELTGEEA